MPQRQMHALGIGIDNCFDGPRSWKTFYPVLELESVRARPLAQLGAVGSRGWPRPQKIPLMRPRANMVAEVLPYSECNGRQSKANEPSKNSPEQK